MRLSGRHSVDQLLNLVVFGRGFDQENQYRARSRWNRFIATVKRKVATEETDLAGIDDLRTIVAELVDIVGRDAVVGLSPAYSQGDYLQQQIDATIDRAHSLLRDGDDPATALASFSGDRAVRIMSIHKSKGLEFDTVVALGVENQTFWGDQDAERSAFFVCISRAKRRLYLTVCEQREKPEGAKYWKIVRTEHDEFVGYRLTVRNVAMKSMNRAATLGQLPSHTAGGFGESSRSSPVSLRGR